MRVNGYTTVHASYSVVVYERHSARQMSKLLLLCFCMIITGYLLLGRTHLSAKSPIILFCSFEQILSYPILFWPMPNATLPPDKDGSALTLAVMRAEFLINWTGGWEWGWETVFVNYNFWRLKVSWGWILNPSPCALPLRETDSQATCKKPLNLQLHQSVRNSAYQCRFWYKVQRK